MATTLLERMAHLHGMVITGEDDPGGVSLAKVAQQVVDEVLADRIGLPRYQHSGVLLGRTVAAPQIGGTLAIQDVSEDEHLIYEMRVRELKLIEDGLILIFGELTNIETTPIKAWAVYCPLLKLVLVEGESRIV